MKCVIKSEHPYEVEIATFLSSEPLVANPQNHCIPIYDVLEVPDDPDKAILVMPLTRSFNRPRFQTVGEAIDFFSQFFEVRSRRIMTTTIWTWQMHRAYNLCIIIMSLIGTEPCVSHLILTLHVQWLWPYEHYDGGHDVSEWLASHSRFNEARFYVLSQKRDLQSHWTTSEILPHRLRHLTPIWPCARSSTGGSYQWWRQDCTGASRTEGHYTVQSFLYGHILRWEHDPNWIFGGQLSL